MDVQATTGGKKKRKISVIFAADVAGYSRLMNDDEDRTLAMLERARGLIDPMITGAGGRIANTAGDSVIAVFESASDALGCAIRIQKKLGASNARLKEHMRLQFRIGLHMGEIYYVGRDVLGSGVNIAARIEGITEPGAIGMSEAVFSLFEPEVFANEAIADLGRVDLKGIEIPVQIYEIGSSRATISKAKITHDRKVKDQNQRLFVVGAALGAVVLTMLFAVSLGISVTRIVEMAAANRPTIQSDQ